MNRTGAGTLIPGIQTAYAELETREDRVIFSFLLLFLLSTAFSIFLAQVGYFGALSVWIGGTIRRKKFDVRLTGFDAFIVAYAVAELVSTILAYNKPQSLLYMQRRLLLLPIIYLLGSGIRSAGAMKYLLAALVASAVGVALWSCRDLILHLPEYLRFERRLKEFQMYMTAGGIMMINALLLIPFLLHRAAPARIRWASAFLLVPIGINLLFTFTRSSWLGFLVGGLVIGLRRHRRFLLIPVLVAILVVILGTPEMQDRILSIADPTHPANATRLHMWKVGWLMFLDHPLFGIGDMGTEQLWNRYADPGWTPEGHLHNNLIMWLVTLGIAGFCALVGLFIRIWIRLSAIESRLKDDWFLGSLTLGSLAVLAGFHVNGLFEWNFGDAEIIMVVWTTVGLSVAAERLPRAEGSG
jgi:O-antigen ligase